MRWVRKHWKRLAQLAAAFVILASVGGALWRNWDDVELGSLGEWVSGLGAAAAVIVALWVVNEERRLRAETEDGARRLAASSVAMYGDRRLGRVKFMNGSNYPLAQASIIQATRHAGVSDAEIKEAASRRLRHLRPSVDERISCTDIGVLLPKEPTNPKLTSAASERYGLAWRDVWGSYWIRLEHDDPIEL